MDALKEKFSTQFVKAYSFLGQNNIEVKKALIAEIMTFMRDNPITPCNYLADETAVHWPKDEEFEIVVGEAQRPWLAGEAGPDGGRGFRRRRRGRLKVAHSTP